MYYDSGPESATVSTCPIVLYSYTLLLFFVSHFPIRLNILNTLLCHLASLRESPQRLYDSKDALNTREGALNDPANEAQMDLQWNSTLSESWTYLAKFGGSYILCWSFHGEDAHLAT